MEDLIKLYNFREIYDANKQTFKNPKSVCQLSSDCDITNSLECTLCNDIAEAVTYKLQGDQTTKDEVDLQYLNLKKLANSYENDLMTVRNEITSNDELLRNHDQTIKIQIKKLKFKNALFEKLKKELISGKDQLNSGLAQREVKQHDRTPLYFFTYYLFSIPTSIAISFLFLITIICSLLILFLLREMITQFTN